MPKQPMMKKPQQHRVALVDGRVAVAITRKYNVRQYETVDIHISAETEMFEGESQSEAVHRIYNQLRDDAKEICDEVRLLAQNGQL